MTAAALEPPAGPASPATASRSGYLQAVMLIVAGFLATTLAQPQVLARLPLANMMKNELGLSRSAVAGFFFLCGLPWYFKIVAGIVTDAFPVLGSRRKVYLVAASALTAAGWAVLAVTPHQYRALFWVCTAINVFMVVASTVLGGYMVEIAQLSRSSGRLSSIRNITQAFAVLVNQPSGGYLAAVAFGWTAGICGGIMLVMIPATLLLLAEQRKRVDSRQVLANFGMQFNNVVSARTLWTAAGLTLLVFIAPGFTTALFFKQQNDLHMTTVAQGYLGLTAAIVGIITPFVYLWACRRYSLRLLLAGSIGLAAVTHLGYLFYTSTGNAYAVASINGFSGTLIEVALMDLAVRATPTGSESLGFALMVSVRNFALFGTDWLGSLMLDNWRLPFNDLVMANAAIMAIAVPVVFLLPAVLVRRKEAEVLEEFPEPATQMQE
jgi:hypothetical protein